MTNTNLDLVVGNIFGDTEIYRDWVLPASIVIVTKEVGDHEGGTYDLYIAV